VKFFIKLLLKAGITLGVMFIGYKYILGGGMGGFQIPGMGDIVNKAPEGITGLGNAVVEKDVKVYQWVDDKGVTHYGGTAPTGQGAYEEKNIRANTNLVNAYKAPEKEEETSGGPRISRVGSLYTPEGVKDLVNDAKDSTEKMSERMEQQQKMLNDLMGQSDSKKK